jgi:hypothetical protein
VRHLLAEHPATEDKLVHALVTAASPQHTSATNSGCPFCDDYHSSRNLIHPQSVSVQHEQAPYDFRVSIDVHQRHLSCHMEQLALFAVPPTDDDDDDEASEDDMDPNVDEVEDYDDEDDDEDDNVVEHPSQGAEDSTDLARQMDALKANHEPITRYAPDLPGRTNDLETVERRVDGGDIVEMIEEHSIVSGVPPPRRRTKRDRLRYTFGLAPLPQPAPGEISPPILNEYGYKTDRLGGVHDPEPDGAPRGDRRQGNYVVPISSGEPQDPTDSRDHALGLPERRNSLADSWPDSEPPDPREDLRPTDQDLSGVHHVELDPPDFRHMGRPASPWPDSPPLDPMEIQVVSAGLPFKLDLGLSRQAEDIPRADQDPSDFQRYGLVPPGQNNPEVAEPTSRPPDPRAYTGPTEKDARGPLPDPRNPPSPTDQDPRDSSRYHGQREIYKHALEHPESEKREIEQGEEMYITDMEIQLLKDEAMRSSQLEEIRAIDERMKAQLRSLERKSQEIEDLLKFESQKRERPKQ